MTITVKRRTPRTEMHFHALILKVREMMEAIAEENELPRDVVDIQLSQFLRFSVRCECNGVELDFEAAEYTDSLKEIRAKFEEFLDTDHLATVESALLKVIEIDQPTYAELGPALPPDTSEKKSPGGKTGSTKSNDE